MAIDGVNQGLEGQYLFQNITKSHIDSVHGQKVMF